MFVSFLQPFVPWGPGARHLAIFYKQLGSFSADDIAYIGSSDYFRSPAELEAAGRMEWRADMRQAYHYAPPSSLDGVRYVALPDGLFAAASRRRRTPLQVYRDLVTRRVPELEAALREALDRLARVAPIEGILCLLNVPSVKHVAGQLRIPVVQFEVGPVRTPEYAMTGYWDVRHHNRYADAARRFRRFQREAHKSDVALLTREELARALRRTPMPDGPTAARALYRLGLALQGEDDSVAAGIGPIDLITVAARHVPPRETLIRHHPMGWARYDDRFGVIDVGRTTTEFILQCETLLTLSSGTAFEALLLGRRCVVLGDCAFRLAADRSFDASSRRDVTRDLLALNFLTFGYLVPYALVFDADYTRWRLTDPPEIEIYRTHQRWYQDELVRGAAVGPLDVTRFAAARLLDAVVDRRTVAPTCVFGAGAMTHALFDWLRPHRFPVLAIFDNDPGKWGSRIGNVPVAAPRFEPSSSVLVASLTHGDAMVSQLRSLGYPDDRITRLVPAA